jgi:hypothetical protein
MSWTRDTRQELDRIHAGAAASLCERLSETLTVLRLGVPPTLARTLSSTHSIESMISIARTHSRNVKRWQSGIMALRWCAAGMAEAGKSSAGSTETGTWPLWRTLDEHVEAETVSAMAKDEHVIAAWRSWPSPKINDERDILAGGGGTRGLSMSACIVAGVVTLGWIRVIA